MAHYDDLKTADSQKIFNVIAAYPFAMICKNNPGNGVPDIVSVPAIRSTGGDLVEFHIARGNPAWPNFEAGGDVSLVFNGPSAHISPSWYKDRFANGDRSRTAPTWDYVQATVSGPLQRMDETELTDHLRRLTTHFEGASGWGFSEIGEQTRSNWQGHIAGFTVRPSRMEAIFKLSQEQADADRAHIVDALNARASHGDLAVASLIKRGLANGGGR